MRDIRTLTLGEIHKNMPVHYRDGRTILTMLIRSEKSAPGAEMSAWVLEHADSPTSRPRYWAAGQIDPLRSSAWTENHMAAIRFAREDDAQAVANRLMVKAGVAVRVCEHTWTDATALSPSDTAPSPNGAAGEIDWKKAFAAQSRKLQAVLHIPGVREELAKLVWSSDTAPSPKVSDGVREALRPFAKEYERIARNYVGFQDMYSDDVAYMADRINLGMLRRASEALAALSQEHAPGRKESQ